MPQPAGQDVQPDDDALMRRLAAGERAALEALYRRHAGRVFATAYHFLLDEQDACDITQAVFAGLERAAHRYRARGRFAAWLRRVVVNRCLNHRARAERRLRRAGPADDALAGLAAPERERPDRRAEQRQQMDRLRRALLRLPARQRLALILKRFDDLSYAEIATALDCSPAAVESLLHRARRRLQRLLAD